MAKIKEELDSLNVKPKKSLGQNFLLHPGLGEKIIRYADLKDNDLVVEIGPGTGILTKAILDKGASIIAIEKDKKLASLLSDKFSGNKKLKVIESDILKMNINNLVGEKKYKVIANLPYNISLPVIRLFLEAKTKPELMILMVQKEVGERICSKPPKMSKIGVFCQLYSKVKIIMAVNKNNFWPKPKVDSVVIKIETKKDVLVPHNFFKIVSLAFSNPRKQIINNLAVSGEKELIKKIIKKAEINPKSRAENLSINDWLKLSNVFPLHKN